MTKQSTIATTLSTDGALVLTFDNGEVMSLHPNDVPADIRMSAMLHGFKQKLVDAAAIARNPDTGRSATTQDKFDAVNEVYKRLLAGEWNKVREGEPTGGLLLRALMELKGTDKATTMAWLEGKTTEEKNALRKNPKVAAVIATLKPEAKPSSDIDTDAMLGEL